MATPQENIARFQEIANRGLQDKLDPEKRARFDEAVKRGIITLPAAQDTKTQPVDQAEPMPPEQSAVQQPVSTQTPQPERPRIVGGRGMAAQQAAQNGQDQGLMDQANEAFLQIPGARALAEFATGANKSIASVLDFFGPDTVNALLELSGSQARMPTVGDAIDPKQAFMEPGTGRDVAQTLGSLLPVAAGAIPAAGRNLASAGGIAGEALGLGSAAPASPVAVAAQEIKQGASKALAPVKSAVDDVVDALPSAAKRQAKLPLYRQSGDVAAAGFKLDDAGRVVKDKIQQKALKAGLDEGLVAMISASNKPTRGRINEMVEIIDKGRKNLEFSNFNPPSRVVGQAIKDRLQIIMGANREAAKRLDTVANNLKGKATDVSPAIQTFLDDLAENGIKFDPQTARIDFTDSTIEGLEGAQGIIKRVIGRLYNTNNPNVDAYRVHIAKKFIDEQVSYGRSQQGLSGTMDRIIKRLRHNLDKVLDDQFPEYDAVNRIYSDTRGKIDDLQSMAGKKVNLHGDNLDKALGVMSRKVLSNYASGTAMEDLFDALDETARRYSTPLNASIDDDLKKLVSAEAALRKLFPSAIKPNTFQGEIGTEVTRAARDAAMGNQAGLVDRGLEALGKVFSKGEEEKLAALKELLSTK